MVGISAKFTGAIVAVVLLASCATTRLTDTWSNPDRTVPAYRKLMVAYSAANLNERKLYEDIVATDLRSRGIEVVTSAALIPEETPIRREALEKALNRSGAEAVLSIQNMRQERQRVVEPGSPVTTYPDFWYPPVFQTWHLYDYFGDRVNYEPPVVVTYSVGTFQANLFDAKTGKLAWAASLVTKNPNEMISVINDVAEILAGTLAKEGFI